MVIREIVKIREAKKEDFEVLRNIFNKILQEEFIWESESSHTDFDECIKGEAVYVASLEDRIVGFISIWEPDCFVHNLFVDSSARNRGVGYSLLQDAKDQYSKQPLTLKCVQANEKAYRFYRDHGWSVVEAVDHEDIPYYQMRWDNSEKV